MTKTKRTEVTESVHVRMPATQIAQLRKIADKQSRSMGYLIRQAVVRFLNQEGK